MWWTLDEAQLAVTKGCGPEAEHAFLGRAGRFEEIFGWAHRDGPNSVQTELTMPAGRFYRIGA